MKDSRTLIVPLLVYIGNALSGVKFLDSETQQEFRIAELHEVPKKSDFFRRHEWLVLGLFALLELSASILCVVGLSYCGSGIYQIVYSSMILFIALLSYLLSGKKVTKIQFVGIIIVVIALILSGLPTNDSITDNNSEAFRVIVGILLTLGGTFLYATSYAVAEYVCTKNIKNLSPKKLTSFAGLFLSILIVIYMIPTNDWNRMQKLYTTNTLIQLASIGLISSGCLHNLNYYCLIEGIGATATGIMQGLIAVGVFISSAILFCSEEHEYQCFNYTKLASALLVLVGVTLYTIGKPKEKT